MKGERFPGDIDERTGAAAGMNLMMNLM